MKCVHYFLEVYCEKKGEQRVRILLVDGYSELYIELHHYFSLGKKYEEWMGT